MCHISMLLWPFSLEVDFVKGGAPPQPTLALPLVNPLAYLMETTNRMVVFEIMHLLPANSSIWLPKKCDYQTNTNWQTDRQSNPMCPYTSQVTQKNQNGSIPSLQVWRSSFGLFLPRPGATLWVDLVKSLNTSTWQLVLYSCQVS